MKKPAATIVASALLALSPSGCASSPVQETISSIDAIGEVTLDSSDAIDSAQQKYDSLSETEKDEVNNIDKLEEAKARFGELSLEKECFELIDSELNAYCNQSFSQGSIIGNSQARANAITEEAAH